MVSIIEKSIINLLSDYSIASHKINGAPGVYVDGSKIAALGLKVKQGKTYHGLSLNVDMDLSPFDFIDPCGYEGLAVTQLKTHGISVPISIIQDELTDLFVSGLGYSSIVDGSSRKGLGEADLVK